MLFIINFLVLAQVLSDLRFMDDSSKTSLDNTLEMLNTRDSTNMWDGMKLGADILLKGITFYLILWSEKHK